MKKLVRIEEYALRYFRAGKEGKETPYGQIRGRNSAGDEMSTLVFEDTAVALNRELDKLTPEGAPLKEANLVVEVSGDVRTPKDSKKPPYFRVHSFSVLTGPVLEKALMRLEAAEALHQAERAMATSHGNTNQGYLILSRAMARLAGHAPETALNETAVAELSEEPADHNEAADKPAGSANEAPASDDNKSPSETATKEPEAAPEDGTADQPADEDSASEPAEKAAGASEADAAKAMGVEDREFTGGDPEENAAVEYGLNSGEAPATDEADPFEEPRSEPAQKSSAPKAPSQKAASGGFGFGGLGGPSRKAQAGNGAAAKPATASAKPPKTATASVEQSKAATPLKTGNSGFGNASASTKAANNSRGPAQAPKSPPPDPKAQPKPQAGGGFFTF